MIPYAPLNGVSLSWCSLTERLIKRHDLWLIKAKSVIKEIDFNLQGERREEKRQAGELCWGHCWHAMICNAGTRGPLWGFTMTPHGASRARTCSKTPCKVPSQSHMANPEFVSQLQDKRNQRLSSHLLLYLTLLIFDGLCYNWEDMRGLPAWGAFSSRMQKKVWDANHFRSIHMEFWDVPSLRDGGWATHRHQRAFREKRDPHLLFLPLLRKWETKAIFTEASLPFTHADILQSLAGFFQPPRKAFPAHPLSQDPLFPPHTLKSHQGKQAVRLQD